MQKQQLHIFHHYKSDDDSVGGFDPKSKVFQTKQQLLSTGPESKRM